MELDYEDDINLEEPVPVPSIKPVAKPVTDPVTVSISVPVTTTKPANLISASTATGTRERFLDTLANDPEYFFLGAPSCYEPGETARVIHEAKERARHAGCKDRTVKFIPQNLLCIQKVETVTLPSGERYELSSYWIEKPECKKC